MRTRGRPSDIVVLGQLGWEPRMQRPQHFVTEFLRRGHRVAYVNHVLTREAGSWRDVSEALGTPDGLQVAELGTVNAPVIHYGQTWSADDTGAALTAFDSLCAARGLRKPVLFVQAPGWWPLVRALQARDSLRVVYDCIDEHTGWYPEHAAAVRGMEMSLARSADVVLAVVPSFAARLMEVRPEVLVVPNACDPEHFAVGRRSRGPREVEGAVVGFFGAIGPQWFDAALVRELARRRPEWKVVVVGPIYGVDELSPAGLNNLEVIGEVPYADLPVWCKRFDVALVPWFVNDMTRTGDPVKVWEYAAAGLRIVTTELRVVPELSGLIVTGGSVEEIERALMAELAAPDDGDLRAEAVCAHTWAARIDTFEHYLGTRKGALRRGLANLKGS